MSYSSFFQVLGKFLSRQHEVASLFFSLTGSVSYLPLKRQVMKVDAEEDVRRSVSLMPARLRPGGLMTRVGRGGGGCVRVGGWA